MIQPCAVLILRRFCLLSRALLARADEVMSEWRNVRYWPKADVRECTANVCFRGKADIAFCSAHLG